MFFQKSIYLDANEESYNLYQFMQGCGHIILHDGEQHNYIIGPIAPHGIARTVTPVLVEHI